MSDEFEELEQIPWAALAANSPSPRNRYLAAAAVVVILAAATAWIATRSDGGAVSIAAPAVRSIPIASDAPAAIPPPSTAPVYSEADLMLIDTGDETLLAIMQAEWLVRDLLTVDGDPLIDGRIVRLLPGVSRSDTPAYVEWARAFAVESVEPGRYRVEVIYRTLTGTEEGYVRQQPGALAVELAIDVGGSASLVGEPEPVPLPSLSNPAG
ncbi:MAG: hypothetical protein QNJ75_00220 [Acidimicrobiia bacterium]|nr:hypothetical protein [Acidimicrobiia bacterium]